MSIFIALLAYEQDHYINNSKIAILLSSLIAGFIGYLLLSMSLKNQVEEE